MRQFADIRKSIQVELGKGLDLSIIKVVNDLIEHAYSVHASDIHICPIAAGLRIRYRIDGTLEDAYLFQKAYHAPIISRIKVLAGLRTDEHQAAQDGRFSINIPDIGVIDVRISIAPTNNGENAVLRLLSDRAEDFSFSSLGFSEADEKKIQAAIKRPFGMILSTGPTGSGKTTTLYTIIKTLNTKEASIITIEDPIEYSVEGITQIQVNPRTDLTFANGLRSILRQDPNVIMVGEIRDLETATIAVNTSLTGHLLLSTLHTIDAATALPRLLDMRIEPFLIASTVNVVIGQRLVRKICQFCKMRRELTESEREALRESQTAKEAANWGEVCYGKGCESCNYTGYSGRVGINEVLVADNDIREAILRKASARDLKDVAVKNGMTTMLEDGLKKAKAGHTTVQEVLRVIHD